jgi:hypothetical protein
MRFLTRLGGMSWLVLAAWVACVGCGSGTPRTYPVSGVVMMGGAPVAQAQVMFTPEGGRAADGVTDETGRFTLSTYEAGDGAIAGTHRVAILKMERDPSAAADDPYAQMINALPAPYANAAESPLPPVEVTAAGPNEFTFTIEP